MIIPVDGSNIRDAAAIHSASWQESHRSFCSPDFVALHTPEHQLAYLQEKLEQGSRLFMLTDGDPVGIVSVTGSLIEDLYILPDSLHLLVSIAVKSIPRKIVLESFSRAMLLEPDAFDFLSDNVYYYDRKKGTLRILSVRTKKIS